MCTVFRKNLFLGYFHLGALKTSRSVGSAVWESQAAPADEDTGNLLNMQVNNLAVGGRDWKSAEGSLWSMGHS